MIAESEYVVLAQAELAALIDCLDRLQNDDLEAELASDILTLEFPEGASYVINSHRAARQIWMAAENTAWHFDWAPDSSQWIAHKSGDELWATVRGVLERRLKDERIRAIVQRPS